MKSSEKQVVSGRRKILMIGILLFMFNFFLVIVFSDNGLVEVGRLKSLRAETVDENERLVDKNRRLYRVIRRLKEDPEYIEMIARKELGMIGRDELIFKFQDHGSGKIQ